MKLFTKTFAIVGLLSVFLVFPKSSLASELSMDKLLNHNEDGTLKEGCHRQANLNIFCSLRMNTFYSVKILC